MDPNLKLLFEDLLKQVHEEIKEVWEEIKRRFTVHFDSVNQRFTRIVVEEKARDECVAVLEMAAAAFDNSFATWKPEVEASLGSIKLELAKLNLRSRRQGCECVQIGRDPSGQRPSVLRLDR
jgi:hypothetical protein